MGCIIFYGINVTENISDDVWPGIEPAVGQRVMFVEVKGQWGRDKHVQKQSQTYMT